MYIFCSKALADALNIKKYFYKLLTNPENDGLAKQFCLELHNDNNIIPANISLSSAEVSLATTFCRESIMKAYVQDIKDKYDYIIIDCMPSLGVLTVNSECSILHLKPIL